MIVKYGKCQHFFINVGFKNLNCEDFELLPQIPIYFIVENSLHQSNKQLNMTFSVNPKLMKLSELLVLSLPPLNPEKNWR